MPATRYFLLIVLLLGTLAPPIHGARTVVVLDPGHGGHDRGARWGPVSEKTITLNIARRVEKHLKARGFLTAMTRRSDVFRSLESRAAMANGFRRSVFVSIHCNSAKRRAARGIETFYCGAPGRSLAASIHTRLDSRTSTPNRGIKFRGFSVLRRTSCPAALVECGFLTCATERRLLTTGIYQDRIALAISDGIARSLNR
jgi:N-acetylmuramoyl-L-alanine amidase